MAAKTTAQAGDWATGSTWTGGSVPATTDTVTISHAVTVNTAPVVVGDGTTTVAIQINSPGSLTYKYSIDCTGGITVGNLASLKCVDDGSQLTATKLRLINSATVQARLITTSSSLSTVLDFNSTGTRMAFWEGDNSAGGALPKIDPSGNGTRFQTQLFGKSHFTNFGESTVTGGIWMSGAFYISDHAIFDNCGRVYFQNNNQSTTNYAFSCGASDLTRDGATDTPNGKLTILNPKHVSSVGAALRIINPNAQGSETRCFNNVSVWNSSGAQLAAGIEFQAVDFRCDSWFMYDTKIDMSASGLCRRTIFTRSQRYTSTNAAADCSVGYTVDGGNTFDRSIILHDRNPSGTQGHPWDQRSPSQGIGPNIYRRIYMDGCGWSNGSGNDLVVGAGADDIQYCIGWNAVGNIDDGAGAGSNYTIQHNTWIRGINVNNPALAMLVMSESVKAATKLTHFRSNLCYQGAMLAQGSGGSDWTPQTQGESDYNCLYQPGLYTAAMLRLPDGSVSGATAPQAYVINTGTSAAAGTASTVTATSVAGSGATTSFSCSGWPTGTSRGCFAYLNGVWAPITAFDGTTATLGSYNTAGSLGLPTLANGSQVIIYAKFWSDGRLPGEAGFGLNDKYLDPGLVNQAFTLALYDAANAGGAGDAGTNQGFISRMWAAKTLLDPSGVATTYSGAVLAKYTFEAPEAAILAAFAPTNAAIFTAAHDGTTMGAVQVAGGGGVTITPPVASLGSVSSNSVALTWTPASGGTGPYTYNVLLSTDGSSYSTAQTTGNLFATLSGLNALTLYYVKIQAVDTGSNTGTGTPVSTTTLAPPGAPVLAVDSATVVVNATLGGANPPVGTVRIRNTGGGSLTGLAVSAVSYGGGWSSGVTASLDTTTAPATLSFQATTGALAVAGYTATVSLSSSASGALNTPQTITLVFGVGAAVTARALAGGGSSGG